MNATHIKFATKQNCFIRAGKASVVMRDYYQSDLGDWHACEVIFTDFKRLKDWIAKTQNEGVQQ